MGCKVCGRVIYTRSKNFCSKKCYIVQWRIDNIQHKRQYSREYNRTHPDRVKETTCKWVEKNVDRVKATSRRYILKQRFR